MEVFVARQPIFNVEEEIVGYELLYRNDLTNVYTHVDGDQATAEVIINSFLNIGLDRLTEGKTSFIHFTENLLEKKFPTYFSPNDIVIKIADTVEVSPKLIRICKELKEQNYEIEVKKSFFDQGNPYSFQLLPFIDFIRVDFRQKSCIHRDKVEAIAENYQIKLIAEKIETEDAYEEAKQRGYQLFQGFLFSEPLIESSYEIPTIFSSYYHDIQNMPLDELDIDELTDLIERDLSFSIKLLRLINPILDGGDHKIGSVREAISLLGVEEIKKWIRILAEREPIEEQTILSSKLLQLTLTRAKLCETIAIQMGRQQSSGFYMIGLISRMEEIVSRSMEEILKDLPLMDEINDALMGKDNILKEVLDLVEAVEQAKWIEINEKCRQLNISERELFRIYAESLNWTTEALQSEMDVISESNRLILN